MPLSPGERLNGYEIVALLGAGGMGEVYRALDTRLRRDVALKVLPERLAADEAAFERFGREARAVAALSHPNILAVFDVGQSGSTHYVVFELLEGASLRERLEQGPLPIRKAVDYARQAADGLAAAHGRGIIHRDIKPDNLFVTDDGRVKILDFGLAQSTAAAHASDATTGVTHTPLTGAGTVLGTVGYMAPEQVRGQAVDHRTDLFALGATLFEMCTGTRAFKGATAADTMSAVLSSDPPEFTVAGHTPPALDRIVRRCLEKQPAERFQSARDLAFALESLSHLSAPASGPAAAVADAGMPRHGRAMHSAVIGAVALALGVGAGALLWRGREAAPPPQAPPLRAEFFSTVSLNTSMLLALSPDGRWLAYSDVAPETGVRYVFVRELASGTTSRVPDSDDGYPVAWSTRSDVLLFPWHNRELRQYSVSDRATSLVAPMNSTFRGATWLDDGSIVMATSGDTLLQRITRNGASAPIVRGGDSTLSLPTRIPGRNDVVLALVVTRATGAPSRRQVVTVRLADGTMTPLFDSDGGVGIGAGYLLQSRTGGLFALPFDSQSLKVTGEGIRIGAEVIWDPPSGITSVTLSEAGVLAFRPETPKPMQFEWLDRAGRSLGTVGPPDLYGAFDLSPDATRLVARLPPSQEHPLGALRLFDIARGVVSPISTPAGLVSDPIWTLDGSRIVYRLGNAVMRQSPYAAEAEKLIDAVWYPDALSSDGRWLLAGRPESGGAFGLFAVPADGKGEAVAIETGFTADEGEFSPDRTLVAFHSSRTGRAEVYLTPFPPTGERWQVSPDGGVQPHWSADGRWLYYVSLTGELQRAQVASAQPQRTGRPEAVFDLGTGPPSTTLEQYALAGDRVLVLRQAKDSPRETVAIVSNWTSLLPAASTPAK